MLALAALVAALGGAPAAAAAGRPRYLAPPGNSAVSQYLEVVPTPAGGSAERPVGGGLTAAERNRLTRLGPDGRALASVVAATATAGSNAPVHRRSHGRHTVGAGDTGAGSPPGPLSRAGNRAASGVPVSSVVGAATGGADGGGLGLLLPLAMIGALVGIAAAAIRRRSR